eukprot:5512513-Prymnesium_polylepis.1
MRLGERAIVRCGRGAMRGACACCCAGRGRRAAGRGSWGYAPHSATGRCGLAPPRTQPPGT